MKFFYEELNSEQWIEPKNNVLAYGCTCKHGSIGRFSKGRGFPCICVVNAVHKWSEEIIERRKDEKKN